MLKDNAVEGGLKMASEQIKNGDEVQLNSGGPIMTAEKVEEWNGAMRVRCQWFDRGELKTGIFPLTSLKLYTGDSSVGYHSAGA